MAHGRGRTAKLALLVLLAACGAERLESIPFAVTDSASVLIARSASLASHQSMMLMPSVDPALEIGEQGGDPEYLLSGIVGVM
jgi:hypothetical protein